VLKEEPLSSRSIIVVEVVGSVVVNEYGQNIQAIARIR